MRSRVASSAASAERGSPALRAAGKTLSLLFRAIPERRRFRAAIALAQMLEPLIARTSVATSRALHNTDRIRETSLDLLLLQLMRHRVRFSPELVTEGAEHLAGGGAMLLVSPHSMLSRLVTRLLHDSVRDANYISAEKLTIAGTNLDARPLIPSSNLLFDVRRAFDAGELVVSMIDRGEVGAGERRASRFAIHSGEIHVSDALLRLALRQGARVVFFATFLDARRQVAMRFAAPPPGNDAGAVTAAFVRFVDETLAAR